jgi:RIO kinase 1
MAIPDSLASLLDEGIIQDILGRIMNGKEAEVFAVMRQGAACAAKVFKPRQERSFHNRASYTEGRAVARNSRTRRAVASGSRFGRQQQEKSWQDAEHDTLHLAFHAGVRVPEPYLLHGDTLLMQLVVDEEGMPAPRLSDRSYTSDQAVAIYHDVYEQVRRLLRCHRIHGDLSAFNILLGVDGPTLIDLPQVVDAAANPQAEAILVRDLGNVVDYLARFAPSLEGLRGAGQPLWRHYKMGTLELANPLQSTVLKPRRESPAAHAQPPRRSTPPPRAANPRETTDTTLTPVPSRERGGRGFSRDGRVAARRTVPEAPVTPPVALEKAPRKRRRRRGGGKGGAGPAPQTGSPQG